MKKNKTHKVLFNGSSLLFTWSLRVFLIIILVSALLHFNKNTIVITIISLIIFFLLYFTSDGVYLILKDNGILYRKKYWLLFNVDTFYDFKNTTFISINGEYSLDLDMSRKFFPGYQHLEPNTIILFYSNNDKKEIRVYIHKHLLQDFANLSNALLRQYNTGQK